MSMHLGKYKNMIMRPKKIYNDKMLIFDRKMSDQNYYNAQGSRGLHCILIYEQKRLIKNWQVQDQFFVMHLFCSITADC